MRSVVGHAFNMYVVDGRAFVKAIDARRREHLWSPTTRTIYTVMWRSVLFWHGVVRVWIRAGVAVVVGVCVGGSGWVYLVFCVGRM